MDQKITPEAYGGFKVFDVITFYTLVFLIKEFFAISLKNRNNYYFLLFVGFIIIFLFGGLASAYPNKTYLNIIKVLPIFVFARFFLIECYKDYSFHVKAIRAIKISFLLAIGFLLIQVIIGLKFTFYPSLHPNTIDPIFKIIRYPGVFYDSQAHGQFLAMGSFLFLYTKDEIFKKRPYLNYIVFIIIVIGITIAGSRAAFGGFAVGLVIVFFLAAQKYRIYGIVFVLLAGGIFMFVAPKSGVFDRAKNLSEDYLFRQSIWKEAYEISKAHPYLGIGYGNYQSYIKKYAQNQYLEIEDGVLVYFDQPENGYLKIMVELGFIGFAIFMLFLLTPIIRGVTYYFQNIYDSKIVFFIASLMSFMVAFNTVYSIYDNRLLLMMTSLIILLIAYPTAQTQIK
jgi:O-antigen ligase